MQSERTDLATGEDSGLRVEVLEIEGVPAVRIGVVVDGTAHQITLGPKDALGVACLIGGYAEKAASELHEIRRDPQAALLRRVAETVETMN